MASPDTASPDIAVTPLAGAADDPIVVLGPSLGTRVERLWATVAESLSGFRVIGWDLPGHGRSATAAQPYSTAELAAAVLAAVDTHVGSQQPLRYAGDSFGGCIGLQLALDHPDRFVAAAIVCSGAKVASEQVWRDRIDLVEREGLGPVQAASSARWFGKAAAEHPTDESRAVLAELLDVDPAGYCQACAALETFDVRDRLPQMQVPLLAVAGADDLVTTAEQNLELVSRTPGSRFEVLPDVGHLAPLEAPEAITTLLQSHFGEGGRA